MINRSDAKVTKIDKGTIGGNTFHIRTNGKVHKLCFRRIHGETDEFCTNVSGFGTSHVGTGACKFHGGADKRPTITTGMTAFQTRKKLDDKIQEYLGKGREELLDLTYHLAATRAIFDDFIEEFPNPNDESYGIWFSRFNSLISTLGTLVDKISRVDSRSTLTAAQVLYLRATMIDVLMKYIPDPDSRVRIIKEIASRMGGDVELEMLPSEISKSQVIDYVES